MRELYDQWIKGEHTDFNPKAYLDKHQVDQADIDKGARILREMEEEGWIRIFNFYSVSITSWGVLKAEERGLIESDTISAARRTQTEFLLSRFHPWFTATSSRAEPTDFGASWSA